MHTTDLHDTLEKISSLSFSRAVYHGLEYRPPAAVAAASAVAAAAAAAAAASAATAVTVTVTAARPVQKVGPEHRRC